MTKDIKPELIEKSAQALHDMRSRRSWAFHEIGQPLGDTVYDDERRADARAALEAVADDLRAEAWDEGFAASERDWSFTYDLTTPDEERQPWTNPYREDTQS